MVSKSTVGLGKTAFEKFMSTFIQIGSVLTECLSRADSQLLVRQYVLLYLLQEKGESSSTLMQEDGGFRREELSDTMIELLEEGWVVRVVAADGCGHMYDLTESGRAELLRINEEIVLLMGGLLTYHELDKFYTAAVVILPQMQSFSVRLVG